MTPDLYPIHVPIGRSRKRYRSGFIDESGQIVIPPVFENVGWFSEGLAAAYDGSRWGYIDSKGDWVIEPVSFGPSEFSGGLVEIHTRSRVGYVNRRGETIIDFNYRAGGSFEEGLTWLRKREDEHYFATPDGSILNWGPFEGCSSFTEGLAAIMVDSKWGFIDKTGQIVIAPQFDGHRAGPFREGLAPASVDGKFGFIDPDGNWAIAPQWHDVFFFSEGLASVSELGGRLIGFINQQGDLVIRPTENIWHELPFRQGLASVSTEHGSGFMDTAGAWAIEPVYEMCGSFKRALCPVVGEDYLAYIRRDGSEVWRGKYVENWHFTSGRF